MTNIHPLKPTQIVEEARAALDEAQTALERAANALGRLAGLREVSKLQPEVNGAKGPHVLVVIGAAQRAAVDAIGRTLDGQGSTLLVAKLLGMLTVERVDQVLPIDSAGIVDANGDDPNRRR